jgi:hypothetical protein
MIAVTGGQLRGGCAGDFWDRVESRRRVRPLDGKNLGSNCSFARYEKGTQKRFGRGPAVAINRKYYKRKWASIKNVSAGKLKPREPPKNVLCHLCLRGALALAKPVLKATRLFRFSGFFQ